ncbi:MAG: Gmad2 immunoglobulin-like domain-containing protein [Thermoanaerobaculia bacterium]
MTRFGSFVPAALVVAALACTPAPKNDGVATPQPTGTAASDTSAEEPRSTGGARGQVRAVPEETQAPRQNVILDTPAEGESIRQNPITVTGKARTFENNVQIRLRDASGKTIRETFTTALGDMGTFNPFSATLFITRDPGGRITVEAFELSAKDGSLDSIASAKASVDVPLKRIRLFLPQGDASASDCTKVFPLERDVPNSVSFVRLLVEALIDGPTDAEKAKGFTSPFPPGSGVESVNLREGTLRVDFNHRLQNVGGSCRAQSIRAAVEQTLGALPEVRNVLITAGGSEPLALQP